MSDKWCVIQTKDLVFDFDGKAIGYVHLSPSKVIFPNLSKKKAFDFARDMDLGSCVKMYKARLWTDDAAPTE